MPAPVAAAGAAAPASGAGTAGAGASGATASGAGAPVAGGRIQIPSSALRPRRRRSGGAQGALRRLAKAFLALLGFLLALLLLVFLPLAIVTALNPFGGGPPSAVPPVYWPMYTAAADYYKVNPYLLASIHQVESDFGRGAGPGVSSGANYCGAAGPMQFGIVGVPPYNASGSGGCSAGGTWRSHWTAAKPIEDQRPASYPLQRDSLDSCRAVPKDVGCVYDSFDAIAGAAHKLHADGADRSLDSKATYNAILRYNASDAYAQHVLEQARRWEAEGASVGATGPVRSRIVSIALGELQKGIHEGDRNCNPYGPCDYWCAMFSTWVWGNAGVDIRSAMRREGFNPYWVPDLEAYAKRHGLWHSNPTPGDMVVWDSHVAIVERLMGGGRISEIGGNQSDAVTRQVGGPSDLGHGAVHGYFSPPGGS